MLKPAHRPPCPAEIAAIRRDRSREYDLGYMDGRAAGIEEIAGLRGRIVSLEAKLDRSLALISTLTGIGQPSCWAKCVYEVREWTVRARRSVRRAIRRNIVPATVSAAVCGFAWLCISVVLS